MCDVRARARACVRAYVRAHVCACVWYNDEGAEVEGGGGVDVGRAELGVLDLVRHVPPPDRGGGLERAKGRAREKGRKGEGEGGQGSEK